MYWTLELASYLEDAPWPAAKDELIDYAIIYKTILSVKTGGLSTATCDAFLNKEYANAAKVNPEKYRIETIIAQFLTLLPTS